MPENQFFTDWVTGDIITADKLNTMKNEVQPYLGYTPLNKAGDNATGDITIQGFTIYRGRPDVNYKSDWNDFVTPGIYRVIDLEGTPINDPEAFRYGVLTVDRADSFALTQTYVPHLGGQVWVRTRYSATDWTPWFPLHHDHQNRFVVQRYVDDITIPPNFPYTIALNTFSVPSGKKLYLRRVRWEFSNTLLRPRVSSTSTWTGATYYGDVSIDQQLSSNAQSFITLFIVNPSSSNQSLSRGCGIWAELEIR